MIRRWQIDPGAFEMEPPYLQDGTTFGMRACVRTKGQIIKGHAEKWIGAVHEQPLHARVVHKQDSRNWWNIKC